MMTKKSFSQYLGLFVVLFGTVNLSHAAFTGAYGTNNWTLVNSNANGTINLSNAPAKIVLTGGNNGSAQSGYTEWRITVPTTGLLQFDWIYSTLDDAFGPWDGAGWRQNANSTQLAVNNSTNFSGHVSAFVNAGETFAFWVHTTDNLVGPGLLTVTNFNFGAAPPRFTKSTVSNQTVLLQLQTMPGRTYRVEATTALPATNWVQIGTNFIASTNLTPITTTASNFQKRFFRAVLLP